MPTVTALLGTDPDTTVDLPTGSKAELQLPPEATGTVTWAKNSEPFAPPSDLIVAPIPGKDDVYSATDGSTTWTIVVRSQPDPPASVTLSPGRGNATVQWPAAANEAQISYYEVGLDPAPATAQLPRHVKSGVTSHGSTRKLAIEGLPPDFYEASVKSVRLSQYGPVASAVAESGAPNEVSSGGTAFPWWLRLSLALLALVVVVIAVVVLRSDPASGTPKQVSLNGWALAVGGLIDVAILLCLTALVNPIGLLLGSDNRISTSRVNVGVWTVVIAFGIITLAAFAYGAAKYHIMNPCGAAPPRGTRPVDGICVNGQPTSKAVLDLAHTFKGGLTANYLVLLGAPFATLAGSAFIVNRQVGNGDRQKVPSTGPAQFTDALTNDDGSADLVDSQYLVFTGVLLFYFFTSFLPKPSTLPDLPWGLVGLTGVSAGTYLLNKSVAKNGLTIISLESSSVKAGASDRVLGQNFLPEGSAGLPHGGVSVMIGSVSGPVTKVSNSEIVFTVPASLAPDTYNVQVTTAANVTASAGTLSVS